MKQPSSTKATPRAKPKPRPALSDAFEPAVIAEAASNHSSLNETDVQSQASTPKPAKRVASNASSAALRQQIAAAKAAARKEKSMNDSAKDVSTASNVDGSFDLQADPFNQAPRDDKHILRNRISAARMDGKLNIAAMSLKVVPDEVLSMYSAKAMEGSKVSWAEVVDLTRLNAADNEIEELSDAVFPDISPEDLDMDDQTAGNQFGGLEMLDLHNNKLSSLPIGMKRLERLTSLNLAHNKLENDAIEVISQIESLKELKLGFNVLSGTLPTAVCNLQNLETLDLHSNRLLVLPEALRELVSLKVLNVSSNQLTSLPMEALQELNLTDLDASSNALIGALFPPAGDGSHPTLRSISVANNSLAAITFAESLVLPQLRTLDVTNNHLTVLPPLSGWVELTTLLASDNKIAELPTGFTKLRKLRNVNFTSNELRLLDPAIAKMEALDSLIVTSNPLREKKFLNMNAADIKRDLKARLEPSNAEEDDLASHEDFHDARDSFSSPASAPSPTSSWTFKSNGELDLAGRGLSDDINDILGSFLQRNEVKKIQLSSNKLTSVPPALWLGQDLKLLDLSGNSLSSTYLSDELELPSLQELNISRCGITTLEPLTTQLHAPSLKELNLSLNRLTGALPVLRMTYPALTTLLAGDNKFTSVTTESLRGLHTVNLASNNIEHLPAEVGLLWPNLRNLDIGSNSFRVPNYHILQKGTEATMRYLRDRIPAAQNQETVNGVGSADDELD
jgi:Leucine-rich repeat (LRR) protein